MVSKACRRLSSPAVLAVVLAVLLSVVSCLPVLALASAPTIGTGGWGIQLGGGYSSALASNGYGVYGQLYYGLSDKVDVNVSLLTRRLEIQNTYLYGIEAKLLLQNEGLNFDSPAVSFKVGYFGYRHGQFSGSSIPLGLVVSKIYSYYEPYGILAYNLTGGYFGVVAGVEIFLDIALAVNLQTGYDYTPDEGVYSAGAGLEYVF